MNARVVIIGGGITGVGIARDLVLRGVDCLLVEKRDIASGASGGNHGLLHSGARYAGSDAEAARECHEEGEILRRMAPHSIEDTGGLFVAVAGDDESYIDSFPDHCAASGLPAEPLSLSEARKREPSLSDQLIAVYAVKDASVDPFRLSLALAAHAESLGAQIRRHAKVTAIRVADGQIRGLQLRDETTGKSEEIKTDLIINAGGAWAGEIAALAGCPLSMRFSKGSLLVTQRRVTHRVINRLRPAADADILVPGGTVSILGTTSERCVNPDHIYPEIHEVDKIIDEGAAMVPELNRVRYIRAYCGVRPLIAPVIAPVTATAPPSPPSEASVCRPADENDRKVSRGFTLVDHGPVHHVHGLLTISGGKLSTFRLMAEKTADRACDFLGVTAPCRTRTEPVPDMPASVWTEPGRAPRQWVLDRARKSGPGKQQKEATAGPAVDPLLCECEMVSTRVVDDISNRLEREYRQRGLAAPIRLTDIGRRTRIGKGPCQGAFCSQRVAARLYDRGLYNEDHGLQELRRFLEERWRGQQPLLWDTALAQAELLEALHCGFFGLASQTTDASAVADTTDARGH